MRFSTYYKIVVGKLATIIKPETITKAEAEKRYDVKITD